MLFVFKTLMLTNLLKGKRKRYSVESFQINIRCCPKNIEVLTLILIANNGVLLIILSVS